MKSKLCAMGIGCLCVLLVTMLPGCPELYTFRLYIENSGATNPITGVYLVRQDAKDEEWGPNLLDTDAVTGLPIPIEPGTAVWLSPDFAAGPTYDWMVQFRDAYGDPGALPNGAVTASGDQLVFPGGMSTSVSVEEISAFASLEDSGSEVPNYGIGYFWGGPEE